MTVTFHPDAQFDEILRRLVTVYQTVSASIGELARDIAHGVPAGDWRAWERTWLAAADQALSTGDEQLEVDDLAGACVSFLQAAEFYRLAAGDQATTVDTRSSRSDSTAHIGAFRAAMPLLPVSCTIIGFTEGVTTVQGYLFRHQRRVDRTVLVPVAVKSTAEAGYAEIGLPVLSQGLDCLLFEVTTRGVGRVQVQDVSPQDWQHVLARLCRYC